LIGQRHTLTKRPLLLDILVDRALIDLAVDTKSWHNQRDIQRDKMVGLRVGQRDEQASSNNILLNIFDKI
jgi:hypothetical protein